MTTNTEYSYPSRSQIAAFHEHLIPDGPLRLLLLKDPTYNPFNKTNIKPLSDKETDGIFWPFYHEGMRAAVKPERDIYLRCLQHQRRTFPLRHPDPRQVYIDDCRYQRQHLANYIYKHWVKSTDKQFECHKTLSKLHQAIQYKEGGETIQRLNDKLWQCVLAKDEWWEKPRPEFPADFPWPDHLKDRPDRVQQFRPPPVSI